MGVDKETEGERLGMSGWMDTHHQVSAVPAVAQCSFIAALQPLAKLSAQQISPAYTLPHAQVSLHTIRASEPVLARTKRRSPSGLVNSA